MRVRVVRVGLTPLKGARHLALDEVLLDAHGPVGDRGWCLVDEERRQVLRSVREPLMAVQVGGDGRRLDVVLPDGRTASGEPTPTGERLGVDYWGREASADLHDGPAADLLAAYVGRPVRLARVRRGDVVYGAPVSLVGTASLRDLAARTGLADLVEQAARFRATFVVATDEPYVEDTWLGTDLQVGDAMIRPDSRIGRCGVINRHPDSGEADQALLRALADFRPANDAGEPCFGVDAVVVRPGTVRVDGR